MSRAERKEAILDVDGTLAPTTGECKEGMGISYNGVWGYHPLSCLCVARRQVISLSNTVEPLYLVNRSGNRPSHDGAAFWLDRAMDLVGKSFRGVCLRGDTDFALTGNFDRWTHPCVRFALGTDASEKLVQKAFGLDKRRWSRLPRREKRAGSGDKRRRPANVKERIVVEKEYQNITLQQEDVAEFSYQPGKCKRPYRVIALKKKLSVKRGQMPLWEDIRYFFYITNIEEMSPSDLVYFCNDRCNQENRIEQLKNGLNALRMPVGDLVSNWAYMVMASLAWTLKAWFALLVRDRGKREALLRMEFRGFLHAIIRIPAQIIRTGHRIIFRILGYNHWVGTFLGTYDTIRRLRLA